MTVSAKFIYNEWLIFLFFSLAAHCKEQLKFLLREGLIDEGLTPEVLDNSICQMVTLAQSIDSVVPQHKKKPELSDEVVNRMLELRLELDNQFSNSKTRKLDIWNDIAGKIIKEGLAINLCGETLQTKFYNFQKKYTKYKQMSSTTGTGRMRVPPYFDKLHAIFVTKHKIYPVATVDSSQDKENIDDDMAETNVEETTTDRPTDSVSHIEPDVTNRFSGVKRKLREKEDSINKLMEIHQNCMNSLTEKYDRILQVQIREQELNQEFRAKFLQVNNNIFFYYVLISCSDFRASAGATQEKKKTL